MVHDILYDFLFILLGMGHRFSCWVSGYLYLVPSDLQCTVLLCVFHLPTTSVVKIEPTILTHVTSNTTVKDFCVPSCLLTKCHMCQPNYMSTVMQPSRIANLYLFLAQSPSRHPSLILDLDHISARTKHYSSPHS